LTDRKGEPPGLNESGGAGGVLGSPKKPEPHYVGHRDRLRERFLNKGPGALAEYELLELVLYRSLPRQDVKPLAKALIAEFGSFAEVIAAPSTRLEKMKGLSKISGADIKLIHAAALAMNSGKARERPLLSSWREVLEYCRAAMAFEEREQFRILFLDKRNQLIRDEVQSVGTVDHTPVYPREVVKRALELASTAIILVHNHPSGDPSPSRADIEMTKTIIDISAPLGISVHDHIVIGRDGHASMKGLQLI
jgi:DNA repair protein RadC